VAHDVTERFSLAERMAAHTIGETAFFEWESPAEPVAPGTDKS
jgi:hypothetical protein